jgi:hypothetical protein
LVSAVLTLAASPPASAAAPVTVTFGPGEQTFTVPDAVTSLAITASGAGGGSAEPLENGGAGGAGSQITGNLAVTPGDVLTLTVGERGAQATERDCSGAGGGGNGSGQAAPGGDGGSCGGTGDAGGGGGQATTVASGPSSSGLVAIAAGGGGGGAGGVSVFGGGTGGSGGGIGGSGESGEGTNAGSGGAYGGSSTAGGSNGGDACDACESGAGGGGGGGLNGGAGGGGGGVGGGSGGGGGAGTDFVSSSLSNPGVVESPAGGGADGQVAITYTPPPFSTAVAVSCTAAGQSPNTVAVDQPATCTATVTDSEADVTWTPTGTVSFRSNGAGSFGVDSCTLSQTGPGVARCAVIYTPSALGSGSHAIGADYGGDATHTESSASQALSVELRSARTMVDCSPNPVATGRETTCTATVTDTSPGMASAPTGTVGFELISGSGSLNSDECTLSQTGPVTASCSVGYTPSAVGMNELFIQYHGDAEHAGNILSIASASVTAIAPRPTSTSVSCSPDTVAVGTPSSCTATVRNADGGPASTPSGTVGLASNGPGGFSDDRCTLDKTRPGVAACAVTYTPAAEGAPTSTDTITATYGGDATRADSNGTAAVTVKPTSPADCKNRGWRNYGFPNQRQCVLFVNSGGLRATASCAGRAATIIGTRAAEKLRGTHGDDVIVTAGGGDRVLGLQGDDLVCGGAGADVIRGGGGADTLRGGPGKDELRGGHGSNECHGGAGSDDQRHC